MDTPATLDELMARIIARYSATTANNQQAAEETKHSVLHLCKSLGALAAGCESFDHTGTFDAAALQPHAAKMVINSLKLAADLGMSPSHLQQVITTTLAK